MIDLAFDLGGRTGVCVYDIDTDRYHVHQLDLTRGTIGPRSYLPAYRLRRRLWCLSDWYWRIRNVIFEESFARGTAKLRLDSLQTVVALWCIEHGLTWRRSMCATHYWHKARKRWPDIRFASSDTAAARWLMEYLHQTGD